MEDTAWEDGLPEADLEEAAREDGLPEDGLLEEEVLEEEDFEDLLLKERVFTVLCSCIASAWALGTSTRTAGLAWQAESPTSAVSAKASAEIKK